MLSVEVIATCDYCKEERRIRVDPGTQATAIAGPNGWFKDGAMGPGRACSIACADALGKTSGFRKTPA